MIVLKDHFGIEAVPAEVKDLLAKTGEELGRINGAPFRYMTLTRQQFKKLFGYEPMIKIKKEPNVSLNEQTSFQRQPSLSRSLAVEKEDEREQDSKSLRLTLEFNSYMRKIAQHKLIRKPIIEIKYPKIGRRKLDVASPSRPVSTRVSDMSADIQQTIKPDKVKTLLASYDDFKEKLAQTLKRK